MLLKTIYQSHKSRLPGTNYREIYHQVQLLYKPIQNKTKRRPYIRSVYFDKQKIFFDYFWIHLRQKPFKDRVRRLQFFACGLELIQHSNQQPTSFTNPLNHKEILYRFLGQSREKQKFFVQIKQNKKTGKKYLMSIFPE